MRRGLIALVLAVAVSGLLVPSAAAGRRIKDLRYNPAFTLDIPDGWAAEEATANIVHPLDFRPKKGRADYSIQMLYLSIVDVTDPKAVVRELAGQQVQSVGMPGAEYDAPGESKSAGGLPLTAQVVRGRPGGADYAYVFILFVVKDHGYVLAVNGPVDALDEGTKVAGKIMDSVRLLKA